MIKAIKFLLPAVLVAAAIFFACNKSDEITVDEAVDRRELQQLIRVWRHDNPETEAHPVVVFPLTAKMTEDGTLVTVNNREELHDLKERCE